MMCFYPGVLHSTLDLEQEVMMSSSARRRLGIAAAFALASVIAATVVASNANAAQGDCSQPLSNGQIPVASDCLYILNAAVLLQTCTPQCICAPSGDLPISATDALFCLQKAVGQALTLQCPCGSGTSTSTTTSSTRLETTTTVFATTTTTIGGGGVTTRRARDRDGDAVCKAR